MEALLVISQLHDNAVFAELSKNLIHCLNDQVTAVRLGAIDAVMNCQLVNSCSRQLISIVRHDPIPWLRTAALGALATECKESIPALNAIEEAANGDQHPTVRLVAYQALLSESPLTLNGLPAEHVFLEDWKSHAAASRTAINVWTHLQSSRWNQTAANLELLNRLDDSLIQLGHETVEEISRDDVQTVAALIRSTGFIDLSAFLFFIKVMLFSTNPESAQRSAFVLNRFFATDEWVEQQVERVLNELAATDAFTAEASVEIIQGIYPKLVRKAVVRSLSHVTTPSIAQFQAAIDTVDDPDIGEAAYQTLTRCKIHQKRLIPLLLDSNQRGSLAILRESGFLGRRVAEEVSLIRSQVPAAQT